MLIPALYRWAAIALAVALGALALAAWDSARIKRAEVRGADQVRAEYTAAALREAQANAAETARRLKAQQENQRAQDAALARARADAARAAADADRVRAQAADAARAASIARTAAVAERSATEIAHGTLANQGVHCADTAIEVDTHGFDEPVGTAATITVTITCSVATADLTLPVPGTIDVSATSSSELDVFRGRR